MTTTVTPTTVKARAPEFTDYDDTTQIQPVIDTAVAFISEEAWGTRYDLAVMALTLHLLVTRALSAAPAGGAPGSGGGSIAAKITKWEQMGVIQRGVSLLGGTANAKASPTPYTTAWFQATSYGQEYAWMESLVFACRVL